MSIVLKDLEPLKKTINNPSSAPDALRRIASNSQDSVNSKKTNLDTELTVSHIEVLPVDTIYQRLIGSESRNYSIFFESQDKRLRITYNNKFPKEIRNPNYSNETKKEKADYYIELNFETSSSVKIPNKSIENIKKCDYSMQSRWHYKFNSSYDVR